MGGDNRPREGTAMHGLMQEIPLMISSLIRYAAEYHGDRPVVSRTVEGAIHRYGYGACEQRARRLANLLGRLGIRRGDRVGTLAWNGYRHLELFYGVSGTGAVLHTVNPRLFTDQIVYIVNHAEDRVLFLDLTFVELAEGIADRLPTVERHVVMTDEAHMPATSLPGAACYETLLAGESADYDWPVFDERTASSLCYTSGTTGNPKGVLYSHRSTLLHAMAACQNSAMGLSAHDTIMPIAPMYHGNAWSLPYLGCLAGTGMVLPGTRMDGRSLQELIEGEGVTFALGVPTVFTMLLDYLDESGKRVDSLERVAIGGSAVPESMIERLADPYGVTVHQLWGMTETSPLGTLATPTPALDALPEEERRAVLARQGRVQFGLELKITGANGEPAPRDGRTFGDMSVRGNWAVSGYFKGEGGDRLDADGWFPTGDVATLDAYGFMRITDRTKDVIKSGGEWISSIDLENAAMGHPDVKQAAVIGVRHPKWEERPLLVVVPREGRAPSRESINGHLAGKVAKWWLPDDVVLVAEMPLTATGKIRKSRLREMFRDRPLPGA